jgi:tRNA A-37 threonylcarbamoyl transferase component Bud32/mono/diheme cytochrome c family protein
MEGWLGMGPDARLPSRTGSAKTVAEAPGRPPALPGFPVPGYELLGVIDQGGMGTVYKAEQSRLKRLVALKTIRAELHVKPQQLARFRAEAKAVAQLQHPNIVQIYEVGESEGHPYFSMEYVEGGSLAQKIAGKPMPPREAAELVATLAEAIHFTHQRGIIHRDLKPANVLLQAHGAQYVGLDTPKITDFGLAKLLNSDSGLSGLGQPTQSGIILGTPSYMAPEQAEGKTSEVGPSVDVYALGAILYEMLTGRPPFRGVTPLDTLLRVVSHPPDPPTQEQPAIPRDLESICLKCLEKSPDQRYPSAAALAGDLKRFLNGQPITARRISAPGRFLKWARRRPEIAGLLTILALVVLALAGVLAVRFHEHQETQRAATRLAPRAREILHRYCYSCHGQDPEMIEENLDILDYALLLDPARKLVIPGDVEDSVLLIRIKDNSMPPLEEEEYPRLSSDEVEDLKRWVAGGAPPFAPFGPDLLPSPSAVPSARAIEVKEIFKAKCYDCHRGRNAAKGKGILILNHDLLVAKRKVIVPGKPESSPLFQRLRNPDPKKVMPPPPETPLSEEQIEKIRLWIAEGAPSFPRARVGEP